MFSKLFRKPYRKIISHITRLVLAKHNPNIIAVMGDGHTSIARELLFLTLNQKYPARRNLEAPEAEFSIPLTILGYPTYPKSYFEWIWVILKTYLGLKRINPYNHFLILELNFTNKELLGYWLDLLHPEVALICGSLPLDYSAYTFKKVVKISNLDNPELLSPFYLAIKQIGKFYRLEEKVIDDAFKSINLPSSKIRILPGLNKSTIIDATYYYNPIKLEAALELIGEEEGNKIIFTDTKADTSILDIRTWQVNPHHFVPKENDVIVLRGQRTKTLAKYNNLITSSIPLF